MSNAQPLGMLTALLDSAAWPILRAGIHIGFFVLVGLILKRIYDFRHLGPPRPSTPALGATFLGLAVLFGGVLVYQASWQLGGMLRPQFVQFMQLHDRRQFNPAHRLQRGRILDHQGVVLAHSEEQEGRVARRYPYGPAFAHAVGYSEPRFGAAGIEAAASVQLNGGAPEGLGDWGRLGRQVLTQDKRPKGQDLVLTLDADLQQLAFELMGGRRGAVVAIQPQTGALRVLLSTPGFDPNQIGPTLFRGTDPATPLLNRATQGLYPPGSTFKVALAALALESGFSGTLPCPAEGFTTSPRYPRIRDHEYYTARAEGRSWPGYGALDLQGAFVKSSNVFFAQLGVRYGRDALYQEGERLYFNRQLTLFESPQGSWTVATGRLPDLDDGDQYGLAQMAIGQGELLTSPLHLGLIAAAVANGGLGIEPRLVANGTPRTLGRLMSGRNAARLTEMMRRVVTEGTGRAINTKELAIAGKTGTAENPHGEAHSWFIGFAPAERPALALAVLVEGGGWGSRAAAPLAQALWLRAQARGLLQ